MYRTDTLLPLATFLLITLCSLGCVQVSGDVDGAEIGGMKSGFWIDTPDLYGVGGMDGEAVYIYVYDYASSCTKETAFTEDMIDLVQEYGPYPQQDQVDDYYDRINELQREYRPEDYWMMSLLAVADDFEDLSGSDFDLDTGGDASLFLIHQNEYFDYTGDPTASYSDLYFSTGGTLTIKSIADGGRARGNGDATLLLDPADEDEDPGEISFSFDVASCQSYKVALEEYYDLMFGDMS